MALKKFYCDKKVRAEIKAAVEKGRANLKKDVDRCRQTEPDWETLWDDLEFFAQMYVGCIRCSNRKSQMLTPRKTLRLLTAACKKIDDAVNCLKEPRFFNWDFVSSRGDRTIVSESPQAHSHMVAGIIKGLTRVRSDYSDRIKSLRRFTKGQKTRRYPIDDCDSTFLDIVLQIGRRVMGTNRVGGDGGPFIKFMEAAVRPVFSNRTPPPEALRTFARRH